MKTRNVQFIQFDSKEVLKTKDISCLADQNNSDSTANQFQNQNHQTVYLRSSQNTRIMQRMPTPSIEGNQSFEFADFSHQARSMSDDQMSARHLMEVR